jgi:hypothetical protein
MTDPNLNLSKEELEKIKQEVDTIYNTGHEFAIDNRNFIKWMTTVSLAVLGFFLGILFSIKAKTDIPLKEVTIFTLYCLFICLIAGMYARLRFELKDWFLNYKNLMNSYYLIIDKAINEYLKTTKNEDIHFESVKQQINIKLDAFNKADKILSRIDPWRIMVIQGVYLFLGICFVSLYSFYYIFIR